MARLSIMTTYVGSQGWSN